MGKTKKRASSASPKPAEGGLLVQARQVAEAAMKDFQKRVPPDLAKQWADLWPEALAAWSPYTLLRPPVFFESDGEAGDMAGQIAAIRLNDQTVMVNLETVRRRGLTARSAGG